MENSFGTDRQKDIYLIPLQLKFFYENKTSQDL